MSEWGNKQRQTGLRQADIAVATTTVQQEVLPGQLCCCYNWGPKAQTMGFTAAVARRIQFATGPITSTFEKLQDKAQAGKTKNPNIHMKPRVTEPSTLLSQV